MAWPNVSITRGDTAINYLKVVDSTGAAMDLAGVTILLTVKSIAPVASSTDLDDALAIIAHGIALDSAGVIISSAGFALGGIDPVSLDPVSGATSGVVTHTVVPALSTTLVIGNYVYDVQVTDASGITKTIINGASWDVVADIGRRTTVGVV